MPTVAWHYSRDQSYLNKNKRSLCSCPKRWPISGMTVPADSLAGAANLLPWHRTAGHVWAAGRRQLGCTSSRCEMWRGWKTSDAAYKNNWSFSTSSAGSGVTCIWHGNDFKAVVGGLWACASQMHAGQQVTVALGTKEREKTQKWSILHPQFARTGAVKQT